MSICRTYQIIKNNFFTISCILAVNIGTHPEFRDEFARSDIYKKKKIFYSYKMIFNTCYLIIYLIFK